MDFCPDELISVVTGIVPICALDPWCCGGGESSSVPTGQGPYSGIFCVSRTIDALPWIPTHTNCVRVYCAYLRLSTETPAVLWSLEKPTSTSTQSIFQNEQHSGVSILKPSHV